MSYTETGQMRQESNALWLRWGGLYREAQFEGLSAGGTIRLWRYSTVGNRPKFPHTSYTFTGKLDLGDVHLAGVHLIGMYLSNVYLIGVYLIGV